MQALKNNKVIKGFMALSVMIHLVALIPHHHHDDSMAACINPLHCVEVEKHNCGEDSVYGAEYCGHTHDGDQQVCTVSHVDVVLPERDSDSYFCDIICHYRYFAIISDVLTGAVISVEDGADKYVKNYSGYFEPRGFNTAYIAKAIPPRAPSFTVWS